MKRNFRHIISFAVRTALGLVFILAASVAVNTSPSLSLTEENLLFLEAWRTIDRAYIDKSFNGQSWFRYREEALRKEPMNTREETYMAIKKMLATLDDPFTRFLEPDRFKSLKSGTQGAITGVGLSIGYPMGVDASKSGLVVVSATPGAPASKAGIEPGDFILSIDDADTKEMDIYDAADRLQGPEGSVANLVIRSGSEVKTVDLVREKVTLNPVKSRLCEISGAGKDVSRVGYIKLTTFNQNASGAVKEAIGTLRDNNVDAFVLDLRDNSGGLFPEGIHTAKIWLEKGVIVYISDNRGVRDIYEADGSDMIATSEPLIVLMDYSSIVSHCGRKCQVSIHRRFLLTDPKSGLYYKCHVCGKEIDASAITSDKRDWQSEISAMNIILQTTVEELRHGKRTNAEEVMKVTAERDKYRTMYEYVISPKMDLPLAMNEEERKIQKDIEEGNFSD